jgi:hypothetical protein
MSQPVKDLIDYIYNTYFLNIKEFLKNKYSPQMATANGADPTVLGDFENYLE